VIEQMETLFPNKNEKLIMICNAGNRSGVAAKAYQEHGYENVYVLNTGMEGLEEE
jgi:rhodanese-related sulfurtransferase